MTATHPSYAFPLPGQFEPLRDPAGRPYRWVPCEDQPIAWDEDSEANVKQNAARRCAGWKNRVEEIPPCPAFAACCAKRDWLIAESIERDLPGLMPRGVWGGVVMEKQTPAAQLTRKRRSRNHQRLPDMPPDRFPVLV